MKIQIKQAAKAMLATLLLAIGLGFINQATPALASGSSGGGGGIRVDSIKVSKCFYDAPTGAMLIKASSSDTTAHLYAYLPSGAYLGEVQNGGGSRYGGTVMPYVAVDPVNIIIISSDSGRIIVPTTPFVI